mmetsp:Transcript_16841/g.25322  ORF Transcript_16841/g.25322 Transcript_16841/m.25322 type:complete len:275 (+) Transcript_16841:133-957(+)
MAKWLLYKSSIHSFYCSVVDTSRINNHFFIPIKLLILVGVGGSSSNLASSYSFVSTLRSSSSSSSLLPAPFLSLLVPDALIPSSSVRLKLSIKAPILVRPSLQVILQFGPPVLGLFISTISTESDEGATRSCFGVIFIASVSLPSPLPMAMASSWNSLNFLSFDILPRRSLRLFILTPNMEAVIPTERANATMKKIPKPVKRLSFKEVSSGSSGLIITSSPPVVSLPPVSIPPPPGATSVPAPPLYTSPSIPMNDMDGTSALTYLFACMDSLIF